MSQSARSTAELLKDVADDLQLLIRKEIELARTQLLEAVVEKVTGVGAVLFAAILIVPALVFLLVAVALALPVGPAWGFAAMGLLMFVIAGGGVWFGVVKLKKSMGLGKTVDSIKEDVRWARNRIKP